MTISEERLRQTFSEDYRVARSALWGLSKASKEELSQLQVIHYYKPAVKCVRNRILNGKLK